jgi:hypothetical protein
MGVEKSPGFLADRVPAMQQDVGVTAVSVEDGGQQPVGLVEVCVGNDREDHEASLPFMG